MLFPYFFLTYSWLFFLFLTPLRILFVWSLVSGSWKIRSNLMVACENRTCRACVVGERGHGQIVNELRGRFSSTSSSRQAISSHASSVHTGNTGSGQLRKRDRGQVYVSNAVIIAQIALMWRGGRTRGTGGAVLVSPPSQVQVMRLRWWFRDTPTPGRQPLHT